MQRRFLWLKLSFRKNAGFDGMRVRFLNGKYRFSGV